MSAIQDVLRRHPDLIEDWLDYSADKRTSDGWYFIKDDIHRYVVGNLDGQRIVFDDPIVACASFIVRELPQPTLN